DRPTADGRPGLVALRPGSERPALAQLSLPLKHINCSPRRATVQCLAGQPGTQRGPAAAEKADAAVRTAPCTELNRQLRQRGCFSFFQAPPSAELATHCVMKLIPSTPSATLG